MKRKFKFSSFHMGKLLFTGLLIMFNYVVIAQTSSYSANTIPISGNLNSAFGVSVLPSSTSLSHDNAAAGIFSMFTNTSGNYNTAVGVKSLYFNLAGNANTAFGWSALYNNASAGGNTAVGNQALFTNSTGSNNTALGSYADVATNALTNATAIGYQASVTTSNAIQLGNASVTQVLAGVGTTATLIAGGLKITGGTLATGRVLTSDGFGNATWQPVTPGGGWGLLGNSGTVDGTNYIGTADDKPLNFRVNNIPAGRLDRVLSNTFFGIGCATSNTSGSNNTAIGNNALASNTTGFANIAYGQNALNFNISGHHNTAIGGIALEENTTGAENVAVGDEALWTNSTGGNNTAIGAYALQENKTGGNNSSLGAYAGPGSGLMTLANSTALGFGATTTANNQVRVGNASVTSIGGYVGWTSISDGRYKKDITENVKGLEFIMKLRPVTYHLDAKGINKKLNESHGKDMDEGWKKSLDEKGKILYSGFVAQEVEQAAKETGYDFSGVDKPIDENGLYGLRYSDFVVPVVKSIQELSKQNEELKKEIEELKAIVKGKTEGSIKITEANNAQLFQNAPNPFNKSTVIKYVIPFTAKKAVLNITSISGTKIKEFDLSNKAQSVEISGGQLPAGTYIYSLYVDDVFIDSKQMILTK